MSARTRLNIGETLDGQPFTLPIDTATLATGTLGIRGSGKTNTGGVIVEERPIVRIRPRLLRNPGAAGDWPTRTARLLLATSCTPSAANVARAPRMLIDYWRRDFVTLLPPGAALAPKAVRPLTRSALVNAWCEVISISSRPQAAMLRVLADVPRGRSMAFDELARRTGQSADAPGFKNNRGRLRSLGVIDYPESDRAAVTELLTPAGLR